MLCPVTPRPSGPINDSGPSTGDQNDPIVQQVRWCLVAARDSARIPVGNRVFPLRGAKRFRYFFERLLSKFAKARAQSLFCPLLGSFAFLLERHFGLDSGCRQSDFALQSVAGAAADKVLERNPRQ